MNGSTITCFGAMFPSLYGQLTERPDASEFFAKVEAMLATADVEALWREPDE